jgi:hypothetical protein
MFLIMYLSDLAQLALDPPQEAKLAEATTKTNK